MVSIIDVAKAAGVSISTVSRVLNHPETTNAETRERILAQVERLNYRPNPSARNFRRSVTGIIGVVMPSVSSLNFNWVLNGIVQQAALYGQSILVSPGYTNNEEEADAISNLLGKPIDAMIYLPRHIGVPPRQLDYLQDVPIVGICRRYLGFSAPCAYSDARKTGYLPTKYLLSLGRRHIAFEAGLHHSVYVSTPAQLEEVAHSPLAGTHFAADRFLGYKQALAEAGVPYEPELVIINSSLDRGGPQTAYHILSSCLGVDGVVAANDITANDIIHSLIRQGFRVPQDISVIGLDDIACAYAFTPSLTTVRQNFMKIGRESLEMANKLISKESCQDVMVDVDLVIRDSTCQRQAPDGPVSV